MDEADHVVERLAVHRQAGMRLRGYQRNQRVERHPGLDADDVGARNPHVVGGELPRRKRLFEQRPLPRRDRQGRLLSSAELRVGKYCVSTVSSGWSPSATTKNYTRRTLN